MSDEELRLIVAKAINGPHKEVPADCKWTLDELREIRWNDMTWQEHASCMIAADSAIKAMIKATGP